MWRSGLGSLGEWGSQKILGSKKACCENHWEKGMEQTIVKIEHIDLEPKSRCCWKPKLVGGFRCIFFSVLLLFWLIQVKSIWVWWYQLSVVTIVIYDLIFWYRRISQAFLSISQYQPLGVRSTGDSTGHTWADAGTCLGDCCWLARQEPHQTTGNLQFYKMVTWFLS